MICLSSFLFFRSSWSLHLVMFSILKNVRHTVKTIVRQLAQCGSTFILLRQSKANMHEQTWPSLVQILAFLLVCRQAIIWSNADLLLIEPLGMKFSVIWIKIQFSFTKINMKGSSTKWRPSCLCHNVLICHFTYSTPVLTHWKYSGLRYRNTCPFLRVAAFRVGYANPWTGRTRCEPDCLYIEAKYCAMWSK